MVQVNVATGKMTVLQRSWNDPGAIAVDSANEMYIGDLYDNKIIKVPFFDGAYVAVAMPGSMTPVCAGADEAECTLPIVPPAGMKGFGSMVFGGVSPSMERPCLASCDWFGA